MWTLFNIRVRVGTAAYQYFASEGGHTMIHKALYLVVLQGAPSERFQSVHNLVPRPI